MESDEIPDEQSPETVDISVIREVIFQYAGTEAALDELCRNGVDPDGFLRLLAFTVEWMRPPAPRRQPHWEIPGMPPRRLLKLAERVEGLAGELEAIEAHPFIKRSYGIVPTEDENEFQRLPELLRKRAFLLIVQVKVTKRLHASIEREIEKRARLNLVEFVRQSTNNGRPMYTEVALLLTAGSYAVGRDEAVTPESLRTLWHWDQSREKKLEKPT
jgi:hypothetical protein